MKKYLLLLLLFSGTVYGEWTKTGLSDESTMFIDMQTVKKTGDLVSVTYLLNLPLGAQSPDKKITYRSSKTVEEYDCKKSLSRTISFEWFSDEMGKGKKVYSDARAFPFEKLTEGSLIDGIRKRVCQ